ncbi:MAG: helix-turn-helix domain-containing protein [Planctomycetota bacterium]|jgi:DNA-binding IclR family transcriptional regulator
MKNNTAPALARGIEIIRFLQSNGESSLEEIASLLNMPKSSASRILETLCNMSVAERNTSSKKYCLRQMLIDTRKTNAISESKVRKVLESLAEKTLSTAEWYIPAENGMVIISRAEPANAAVSVRAKLGFTRDFDKELDAVCALGLAFFKEGRLLNSSYKTYTADGVSGTFTQREAEEKVAESLTNKYCCDLIFNGMGVRRCAALVINNGKPAGIIALAENLLPGNQTKSENNNLKILLAEMETINE